MLSVDFLDLLHKSERLVLVPLFTNFFKIMGDFLCVQPFVGKIEDHPEQIQISLKIPICNSVRMSFGAFLLFSGLPLPVRFRMSPVSAGCPSKRKSPCSADCRLKTMPSPKNHKNRVLKYPSAFLPCYTSFWNDRCFFRV